MPGLLAKERIIAKPGFNRWLVPPAALAIHLSIGMAYGFSTFWKPLSQAIGIDTHLAGQDWKISTLSWTYTLLFVFLGSSAAVFGRWIEQAGPRKAGVLAACCWGGGFLVSALGIYWHEIWLLWLGSGVIGGCGLGIGYLSPVATLIRWFPDRRGLATGLAIMGFGGGALIGAPLADLLIKHFATPTSVGVWQTFVVLGVLYFVIMMCGAFGYRVPPTGWKPTDWTPPARPNAMITQHNMAVNHAWRTPQFWLLWIVLCMNVSAGIGIIGMASPMIQETFGSRLLGMSPIPVNELSQSQRDQLASIGAGFAALLSVFNILGRILWASASDYIGRKRVYGIFFALGFILYSCVPLAAQLGNVVLFVGILCIILTMYGGGFATIPAYLADLFGAQNVGAIHGRLLTAWSTAGVLGPVLITYIRELQLQRGVPLAQVYNVTLYILAGMMLVGFFANLAIRPVAERLFAR